MNRPNSNQFAMLAEGAKRPPVSTVLAITTIHTRRYLKKGVPVRTPSICSVFREAPRGERSKLSVNSVKIILKAAGPLALVVSLSCSCVNRSSKR